MRTIRETMSGLRRGFTLIELLVVMAVIIVLAVVTLVAVRAIAQDARQTRAVNSIKAALGTARAEAMRLNRHVGMVVRPLESGESELVIVVDAQQHYFPDPGDSRRVIAWRYTLLPDTPRTVISSDVRVAAPFYGTTNDDEWITQSDFADPNMAVGRLIGVFFAPDGSLSTREGGFVSPSFIPTIPSSVAWVDFNNDGVPEIDDFYTGAGGNTKFYEYRRPEYEPFVNPAPILAVFDYRNAREFFDTSFWNDWQTMTDDLSAYINDRADIIQFNRYTGVMTK